MDPSYYVLIGVGIVAILFAAALVVSPIRTAKKRMNAIATLMAEVLPNQLMVASNVKFYDFYVDVQSTRYLFKVLPFDKKHELIITNQYFWCINGDLRGWRRSTVPDLCPRVPEFVDFKANTSQKIVKIALIYPDCYNITRYLNESDVALVKPQDLVYGVHFVKAIDLQVFFQKPE